MSTETPVEVPLVERLRRIPKAHKVSIAFQFADNGTATGHSIIPVGYLMHTAADELARLREELAEAKRDKDELRDVLLRNGFTECDIPACNCSSWHHRYGLPERWQEIKQELSDADVLNNETGNLPLRAIQKLRQNAEQAEARALEYKTEHAALLGTSQWQETEIADLRDDVKRLMQTVNECEELKLTVTEDKES